MRGLLLPHVLCKCCLAMKIEALFMKKRACVSVSLFHLLLAISGGSGRGWRLNDGGGGGTMMVCVTDYHLMRRAYLITVAAQDMYRISMGYVSFPHLITHHHGQIASMYVGIVSYKYDNDMRFTKHKNKRNSSRIYCVDICAPWYSYVLLLLSNICS